jgi:hypothetical protein
VLKVALVIAILASPAIAGGMAIMAVRLWRRGARWVRRRRAAGAPAGLPLERVAADLRRLRLEVIRVEEQSAPGPGRHLRLRALRAAYADSLFSACRALDVPVSGAESAAGPLPDVETYRLEAALRERGLDVRPVALR